MDEQKEILARVDTLLKVHDEWLERPGKDETIPLEFGDAAENMFEFCATADVPAQLRSLMTAIDEFESQWRIYLNGAWTREGVPQGTFWRAFRQVIASRQVSAEARPKYPEPIHVLRAQKVTDQQIASEIYGHKGQGPFIDGGSIRFDLIDKEAKEPGSVIPQGWIPPYEEMRLKKLHVDTTRRLHNVDNQIGGSVKKQETVEGLLRDGQYLDVIMQQCNKTEEQVRAVADALGYQIVLRPNLASERAPQEPEINPQAAEAMDAEARNPTRGNEGGSSKPKAQITRKDRQHILELAEAGSPADEIARELGGKLSARQVAAVIQQSRTAAQK